MAITLADLKFFGSERMTDNSDGGGRMSATEIVSGVENSVFDDVSDVDRAAGDVSIRKIYAAITSADTAKYLDASVAIFHAPADPAASVLMTSTGDFYDEREAIKNRIEQTITRGASWNGYLWGQHLVGQRIIMLWQRPENELPSVGARLELIAYTNNIEQYSQFLWITRITSNLRTRYDDKGAYQVNEVLLELAEPLRYAFTGIEPQRVDPSNLGALIHATRYNPESTPLYGIMPIASAVNQTEYSVKIDSLYAPIIPTAMSETALPDVNPGGDSPAIVAGNSASITFTTTTKSIKPDVSLFLGTGFKPGSLSIGVSGSTISDENGKALLSGTEIGTADYGNGIIRWNSSCPNYGTSSKSVSFIPASRPLRVADTASIAVTAENRGFVWVITLSPIPAPMTLRVSYRVNNVWYVITDQGGGLLTGVDSSYGSGTLNFSTGTVTITTGALPDVYSDIMYAWGTPVSYFAKGGSVVNPTMVRGTGLNPGMIPGTVSLSWVVGGDSYSLTDTATAGVLAGTGGTGAVDYATQEWRVIPTTLPGPTTEFILVYQYGDTADIIEETFTSPVLNPDGTVTITLSNTDIVAKSLDVAWNLTSDALSGTTTSTSVEITHPRFWNVVHTAITNGYEILKIAANTRARDDGAGVLVIPNGTNGAVNYAAGTLTFLPTVATVAKKSTNDTVEVGTYLTSNTNTTPLSSYRNALTGWEDVPVTAIFPTDGSGVVKVRYRIAGTTHSATETMTLNALELDLTPGYGGTIVGGSLRFTLGNSTYVDTAGLLYRDPSPDTGAGTLAGTLDRSSGQARITSWLAEGANAVTVLSLTTSVGDQPVDYVVFRTPTAPLKPGTLQLRYTTLHGVAKSKTVDSSGILEDTDCTLSVDYPLGVIRARFGLWKQDSLLTPDEKLEPWYSPDARVLRPDPLNPTGPQIYFIWKPVLVMADSIIYNAVAMTFLPPDSNLLGIDAARLPPDGKGLIFRVGELALVHNTQTLAENSLSPTQVIDCGRTRIYRVVIDDVNGNRLSPAQYALNRELGLITMKPTLDLTGFTAPFAIRHTVADLARIVETDINGTLSFNMPMSHAYPMGTSFCSGLMYIGTMQARVTSLFAQSTWTSVWQDTLIGSEPLAQYNDAQYPIIITNAGAYPDRILVKFTSSTAFQVIGEQLGIIGTGAITQDCSPLNSLTGVAYFTIDYRGWGVGWATGNCLRFNVVSASYPVDLIRSIQPSDPSGLDVDSVELLLLGNVDA